MKSAIACSRGRHASLHESSASATSPPESYSWPRFRPKNFQMKHYLVKSVSFVTPPFSDITCSISILNSLNNAKKGKSSFIHDSRADIEFMIYIINFCVLQDALDATPKLPKDILRGEPMINSGAAGSKSPAMAVVPAANSGSRYVTGRLRNFGMKSGEFCDCKLLPSTYAGKIGTIHT